MDIEEFQQRLDTITEKIIGGAYAVGNELGSGFLEKVYENSLAFELREAGLKVEQQKGVAVSYRGQNVGEYFADLLVEDEVLVEIKAARALDDANVAQCLNYLKATGRNVCLLINFGKPRVDVKRLVRDF